MAERGAFRREQIALHVRRFTAVLTMGIVVGLLLLPTWQSSRSTLFARTTVLAVAGNIAFSLFEVWPSRLPQWVQRWALQVLAVGISMPLASIAVYLFTTPEGAPQFWDVPARLNGWTHLTIAGVLLAPWTALTVVVRQKDAFAREQRLTFELQRSELQRQALDARLHLLKAQVAPHFLFNTLANVQALVDAGSPRASAVLRSLTAYLRGAVPRLDDRAANIEQELQLVRPYLELMHMRMPDRLTYAMNIDPAALALRCPPTMLLTLVENAIRHGIDPSEDGGQIEIGVQLDGDRCVVRVADTGAGFGHPSAGLGTGLTALRERLGMLFDNDASLHLSSNSPRGVIAEIRMPART